MQPVRSWIKYCLREFADSYLPVSYTHLWLNTITIENVHPNTTVAIRMKGISGETGSLKLYAYGTDGTLKEVPAEKWHIQTEDGEIPDTLSEDVLYEVHMTVEDGGDFDLSETEKEIKISAVLGI